ncbi:hypothetical protein H6G33_10485 [Calothrix sp. FACHB-1219]|uniref:hypothetical protein n=1 Tax=unclassified Calothrix TaxID=2619626 RepID=UPI0016859F06|nr:MULTISPECIES: hypothetical protein [unclassified Calothrix]MBD2201774.1 hypothetical protein [Calothrix sp. FACHB-168]MBD2217460.1 hypothetical protein [Calothrix sp. FACHB-1219]
MGRNKKGEDWTNRSEDYEYDEPNNEGKYIRCDYDQNNELMGFEESHLNSDSENRSWLLRFRKWMFGDKMSDAWLEVCNRRPPKIEINDGEEYVREHNWSYVTAGEDIYDCKETVDEEFKQEWEESDLSSGINIEFPMSEQDMLLDRYGLEAYFLEEE